MKKPAASRRGEQRTAARFTTALPVSVDGSPGRTRDISTHGVYIETDLQHRLGALVNVSVEYTLHGRRQQLLCEGKVVRVDGDPQGGRVGVAARLVAPFFEGEEEVAPAPPRSA